MATGDVRYVRSAEGASFYGQPIGSPIKPDVLDKINRSAAALGITPPKDAVADATGAVDSSGPSIQLDTPTLDGPNKFKVGATQYSAPDGATLYGPRGNPGIRFVQTADGSIAAFNREGQTDVPEQLQADLKTEFQNSDGSGKYERLTFDNESSAPAVDDSQAVDTPDGVPTTEEIARLAEVKQAARDIYEPLLDQQSQATYNSRTFLDSLGEAKATYEAALSAWSTASVRSYNWQHKLGEFSADGEQLTQSPEGSRVVQEGSDGASETLYTKDGQGQWKTNDGTVVPLVAVISDIQSGRLSLSPNVVESQVDTGPELRDPTAWQRLGSGDVPSRDFVRQSPAGAVVSYVADSEDGVTANVTDWTKQDDGSWQSDRGTTLPAISFLDSIDDAAVISWEGKSQRAIYPGAESFSTEDVRAAYEGLREHTGFQVFYGIPADSPLRSRELVGALTTEARAQYPSLTPKQAVLAHLRDFLGEEVPAASGSDGPRITIGATGESRRAVGKQGVNGGDYSAEDVRRAIEILEAFQGKAYKSELNKKGSPLGEIDPTAIVGIEKDKTVGKQKFVDYLKSALATTPIDSPPQSEDPTVRPISELVGETPETLAELDSLPNGSRIVFLGQPWVRGSNGNFYPEGANFSASDGNTALVMFAAVRAITVSSVTTTPEEPISSFRDGLDSLNVGEQLIARGPLGSFRSWTRFSNDADGNKRWSGVQGEIIPSADMPQALTSYADHFADPEAVQWSVRKDSSSTPDTPNVSLPDSMESISSATSAPEQKRLVLEALRAGTLPAGVVRVRQRGIVGPGFEGTLTGKIGPQNTSRSLNGREVVEVETDQGLRWIEDWNIESVAGEPSPPSSAPEAESPEVPVGEFTVGDEVSGLDNLYALPDGTRLTFHRKDGRETSYTVQRAERTLITSRGTTVSMERAHRMRFELARLGAGPEDTAAPVPTPPVEPAPIPESTPQSPSAGDPVTEDLIRDAPDGTVVRIAGFDSRPYALAMKQDQNGLWTTDSVGHAVLVSTQLLDWTRNKRVSLASPGEVPNTDFYVTEEKLSTLPVGSVVDVAGATYVNRGGDEWESISLFSIGGRKVSATTEELQDKVRRRGIPWSSTVLYDGSVSDLPAEPGAVIQPFTDLDRLPPGSIVSTANNPDYIKLEDGAWYLEGRRSFGAGTARRLAVENPSGMTLVRTGWADLGPEDVPAVGEPISSDDLNRLPIGTRFSKAEDQAASLSTTGNYVIVGRGSASRDLGEGDIGEQTFDLSEFFLGKGVISRGFDDSPATSSAAIGRPVLSKQQFDELPVGAFLGSAGATTAVKVSEDNYAIVSGRNRNTSSSLTTTGATHEQVMRALHGVPAYRSNSDLAGEPIAASSPLLDSSPEGSIVYDPTNLLRAWTKTKFGWSGSEPAVAGDALNYIAANKLTKPAKYASVPEVAAARPGTLIYLKLPEAESKRRTGRFRFDGTNWTSMDGKELSYPHRMVIAVAARGDIKIEAQPVYVSKDKPLHETLAAAETAPEATEIVRAFLPDVKWLDYAPSTSGTKAQQADTVALYKDFLSEASRLMQQYPELQGIGSIGGETSKSGSFAWVNHPRPGIVGSEANLGLTKLRMNMKWSKSTSAENHGHAYRSNHFHGVAKPGIADGARDTTHEMGHVFDSMTGMNLGPVAIKARDAYMQRHAGQSQLDKAVLTQAMSDYTRVGRDKGAELWAETFENWANTIDVEPITEHIVSEVQNAYRDLTGELDFEFKKNPGVSDADPNPDPLLSGELAPGTAFDAANYTHYVMAPDGAMVYTGVQGETISKGTDGYWTTNTGVRVSSEAAYFGIKGLISSGFSVSARFKNLDVTS